MMNNLHEGQQVAVAPGICNWARKPTIAAARVPAAENRILRAHLPTRCACQIRGDSRSPKLASDWVVKLWNRSPASPDRTQYLRGTAGWLPASSTVPDNA